MVQEKLDLIKINSFSIRNFQIGWSSAQKSASKTNDISEISKAKNFSTTILASRGKNIYNQLPGDKRNVCKVCKVLSVVVIFLD